jgi:hypothetical protein
MPSIAITTFAAAYLFALLYFLGAKRLSYSHIRHTISELGETGSPQARVVAIGVFLPVGMLLLLVAYLALPLGIETAALALCIALGYLVAAAFPCDAGSPLSGTWRQAIHNLGGGVEYIGGAFALLRIAERFGQPFQAFGFIVFAVAIAISLRTFDSVRGLVQRLGELCLFSGLALAIWRGIGTA